MSNIYHAVSEIGAGQHVATEYDQRWMKDSSDIKQVFSECSCLNKGGHSRLSNTPENNTLCTLIIG